jgi:DNA helicase HerA-like ATPase
MSELTSPTGDVHAATGNNGRGAGEVHLDPLTRPGELTVEDRRNVLDGIDGVPAADPVGLIDASVDATTRVSQILIDPSVDLALDTFVVSAQRLVDGSPLFHYGIVTEVSGRVEGAETATDTVRLASATLPGQRFRRAEVTWIRTHPERYLPPSSGAATWIAAGAHRKRALFLDKMADHEAIPIGLDMNGEIVFMPYSFLNGERGAHVSISGKSGVATKTSYALFLLYMLFETEWGLRARGANPHDKAVVFSVKGADLCLLDKANKVLAGTGDVAREAREQWAALGVPEPGPFRRLAVFAPAEDVDHPTPVPDISVRPVSEAHAYGWSPLAFIREGLLQYVFDDLESGQLSFIEQVVRIQLLRWAYPVAGDPTGGKVVLVDPGLAGDSVGHTWEGASRSLARKAPRPVDAGAVVADLDDLVEFITAKVADDTAATYDPAWVAGVGQGTRQAFTRRLWKAVPRLRRLIRAGLRAVDLTDQLSVVDVHALHDDAQRFVVAAVLDRVWAQHEDSTAPGRTFVLLDELNKYAPRQGSAPIGGLLVDIAARGRSLGVILIGAQQNPSGVTRDITNNAALEVCGQIKASESAEMGYLPPDMRARAQIIAPGTMITSQPLLPAPVPVRFPFPPYATRLAEVLGSADDDDAATNLLENM